MNMAKSFTPSIYGAQDMPISGLEYHRQTSYDRHAMGGSGLDWANQPGVFKTYPGLDIMPLPVLPEQPEQDLNALIGGIPPTPNSAKEMTLVRLSEIIQLTHCVTAKARHGATDFYYRNVASAGALYPFELYVAVRGVVDLREGLYHHTLALGGLTCLRLGNVMPMLVDGLQTGNVRLPSLVFFLTSIFFRSSWKYRERAYRYVLLDTGHLVENLFFSLRAQGLPLALHYDFVDESVNRLLAVDPRREGCLAVAPVYSGGESLSGKVAMPEKTDANLAAASQVAISEKEHGLIRQIHDDSSACVSRSSDRSEMGQHLGLVLEGPQGIGLPQGVVETMGYPKALFARRSKRNFVPEPISAVNFGRLLKLVCAPCDDMEQGPRPGGNTLSVGFLAAHVEGVKPGFYLLARSTETMFLVSPGCMTGDMAHICLEQAWLANSAVHFVFLSNLQRLGSIWGARGYRYACLTAGRLGQRIYLGATALGLGCCGIGAFYDGEAATLLGVNDMTALLYVVAVGAVKR
jgi:SagB-type dehydrogenase family enzyme